MWSRRSVNNRPYVDSTPGIGGTMVVRTPRSDARAHAIFKDQYKAAFPGKRINSKHAKAQWEKVKGKALEIAKGEFAVKKTEWNMRNEKRLAAVAAVDAEHQKKVKRYLRRCRPK